MANSKLGRLRGLGVVPALIVGLSAVSARGDWPMARHDAARTGAAPGSSDLTTPAPYWRAYLGGDLNAGQMLVDDLEADGIDELIFVSAGRLYVKRSDGSQLLVTAFLDLLRVVGLADLDGDGSRDIVAYAASGAYAFSSKTGAIEWKEPEGEMGTVGAVRVGDLDGDGKADLLIQECGCCAINSGKTGFAYSFATGFAAPKLLWTLPDLACGGRFATCLLDTNGDGKLEVTYPTNAGLVVLDGKSGAALASSPSYGTRFSFSTCSPVNLDGVAGDELICVNNFPGALPSGRRLFALRHVASPQGVTQLWTKDVGADDGAVVVAPELAVDLDGDGALEVVASGATSGASTTTILDAKSGVELATIAGEAVQGVATLRPGTKVVVTSAADQVRLHTFQRSATPAVANVGSATGSAFTVPLQRGRLVSEAGWQLLAYDPDATGTSLLPIGVGSPPTRLELLDATGTTPTSKASYALPPGSAARRFWLGGKIDRGYPQIVMARSDGYLSVLDRALQSTSAAAQQGFPFGGYYSTGGYRYQAWAPVVGSMDGGAQQSVFVSDSRGSTLRLDLAKASLSYAPPPRWTIPNATNPTIVPRLDGTKPGVVVQNSYSSDGLGVVSALRGDGTTLWTTTAPGDVLSDFAFGNLDGDGTPDLALQWGKSSDLLLVTRGVAGTTGKTLWESTPLDPGWGRQAVGVALSDWNGDAKDDVLFQAVGGLRLLSGADGALLKTGAASEAGFFLPTVFDVDGDGTAEVTLHGGYYPARTLRHDLTTAVWTGTDDDRPYPYGAIAVCPTAPLLVEGSLAFGARVKFTTLSGASAGQAKTLVVADGRTFADEAEAKAASLRLGQLASVSVHANLDGRSTPIAVIGSSDGWVYGFDACAQKLAFSYNFKAPVGDVVFGDTDGDGKDELIATVADGYIYGLKNQKIAAPSFVWDLASAADDGADVDETTSTTSLTAKWGAVAGATGYEVTAIGASGYLPSEPWRAVGDVTKATLTVPLTYGARYVFAVRAVGPDGKSPDLASNGVTVIGGDAGPDAGPDAAPDTGDAGDATLTDASTVGEHVAGAGCDCSVGRRGGRGPSGALGAAVCALSLSVVLGRRRRR